MNTQKEQVLSNEHVNSGRTLDVLVGLLQSVRPHQWVKNAFVLAPLVFAKEIGDYLLFGRAIAAFAIFCAISGAVYLLNDLFDIERDRAHPVKRNRPIPSGRVPLHIARIACAGLATGAIALAWLIDMRLAAATVIYFTLNIAYSSRLKHEPFIDVGIIASGFLLRILAGAFATGLLVSSWLFVCTFLLALFLALGKRQHELKTAGQGSSKQRKVLERYRAHHIHNAMLIVGLATLGAYIAYTLAPHTQTHFAFTWPRLSLTIPFTLFGLWRFFTIANDTSNLNSPTEQMLKDPPFLLNIGGWCVAVLTLVYFF